MNHPGLPSALQPEHAEILVKCYLELAKAAARPDRNGRTHPSLPIYLLSEGKELVYIASEKVGSEAVVAARAMVKATKSQENIQILSQAYEAAGDEKKASEIREQISKSSQGANRRGPLAPRSRGRLELLRMYPDVLRDPLDATRRLETVRSLLGEGKMGKAADIAVTTCRETFRAIYQDFTGETAECKVIGEASSSKDDFSMLIASTGKQRILDTKDSSIPSPPRNSPSVSLECKAIVNGISKDVGSRKTTVNGISSIEYKTEIPIFSSASSSRASGDTGIERDIRNSSKRRRRKGPYAESNEKILLAYQTPAFRAILAYAIQTLSHLGRLDEAVQLATLMDLCHDSLPKAHRTGSGEQSLTEPGQRQGHHLAKVHALLGYVFLHKGDVESAYDRFVKGARAGPMSIDMLSAFHAIMERMDYRRKADTFLLRELNEYPDAVGYHILLGHSLMAKRNYSSAALEYAQAASLDPSRALTISFCQGVACLQHAMVVGGTLRHATSCKNIKLTAW
eukprot:CAMPEP_0167743352 /NCGR_PEP_ID=MMETSP0110_2-20121227/1970_1 /TAXON_ID=629695 /ORGANISM="Gymnochlora sp., Strain CCMP2014" /LENGTH=511 /DNA_ID=CAMNT_0007627717 /DNA_START=27 /DNA_END=1559 /DNA_ORIENTATION=+